jgi:ubiquitin carboxyl-terminal hydrolase 4/11/15
MNNEKSVIGKCGLINLGNTCYMNSAIQCLSHTTLLTNSILDDSYNSKINFDNPLGSKGEIIEEYSKLVKHMWFGTKYRLTPNKFYQIFGEYFN